MSKSNKPGKADYGIDVNSFVLAWEQSETLDEVVEKLAQLSAKLNIAPMPKPIIVARAATYRHMGVNLKKMRRVSSRAIEVQEVNELIERVRKSEVKDVPSSPDAVAAAPPAGSSVSNEVREMLERMGAAKRPR